MRSHPFGLFFHNDTDRLIEAVTTQAEITHRHKEAVAGSVAVALFVQWLLSENTTIDIDRINNIAQKVALIDSIFGKALSDIPQLLALNREPLQEHLRWFTKDNGQRVSYGGVTGTSQATVLAALCAFLTSPANPIESICFAIEVGGDCDTTASIAGALAGAFNGVDIFPYAYLKRIQDQHYAHYEYFNRLFIEFSDLITEKEES